MMGFNYIGVIAIVGDEGSCKTTMALSFPKPLFHFDLDVGGFARAAWRLNIEDPNIRIKRCEAGEDIMEIDFSQFDIITKPYPKPLNVSKLLGQLVGKEANPASVRQIQQPKRVEGMRELWQSFITDFVYVCSQPVATMDLDSATMLWTTAHNTRLQELQEIQVYKWKKEASTKNIPFSEDEYRERLQPMEYGPPNERMTTLLQTSRSFRKNLVLTHYPTDEYGMIPDGKGGLKEGKTGNLVIDGFKHTAKLCDLIVWTSVKETSVLDGAGKIKIHRQPVAKITKCGIEGMGLDAVGMDIAASFDGVISLRNLLTGALSG